MKTRGRGEEEKSRIVLDRNGVRYDPKRKPENLEVFAGLTWWDMPGRRHCHDVAKMNFALFKRGVYDPMLCDDIADPDERKASRRFRRSILAKMQRGNGAYAAMCEAGLAGLDVDATRGPITPESGDDMAEVKARSRAALGFPPLEEVKSGKGESEKGPRLKLVDAMGRKYHQTTMEQRMELAGRVDAWRAQGKYSRMDVLKAMGIRSKSAAFMCPSGITDGDNRWLIIQQMLPALERGELKLERGYTVRGRARRARNDEIRMTNDERRAA